MKIKKTFYVFVLGFALVLGAGSLTVFGNNSSDTGYVFNFPIGTNVDYTGARAKVDNSSAYMKLKEMQGASHPSFKASIVKGNYKNFSKTWYYNFDKSDIGKGRYLSNYAYEDDGLNVKVRIKAARGGDKNGFYGSGVWSPDSI